MKRSPLKRKTPLKSISTLKRTGKLRQVSKKKRNHQSASAKHKFMVEHTECQARKVLQAVFAEESWPMYATDPHHIAFGCPRHDKPCNLIACSRQAHERIEKYVRDGFVWSLYGKLLDGELDISGLQEIMGKRSIVGLLELADFQFRVTVVMAEKILNRVQG